MKKIRGNDDRKIGKILKIKKKTIKQIDKIRSTKNNFSSGFRNGTTC